MERKGRAILRLDQAWFLALIRAYEYRAVCIVISKLKMDFKCEIIEKCVQGRGGRADGWGNVTHLITPATAVSVHVCPRAFIIA